MTRIRVYQTTIADVMNISKNRDSYLWEMYIYPTIEKFNVCCTSVGDCLMAIANTDELTSNEKCYCCAMVYGETERIYFGDIYTTKSVLDLGIELGVIEE